MGVSLLLLPSPNNLKSRIPIPSPKSQSYAMSRSSYPSAHGHTPSYRSAASTVYPSALGSDTGSFSSGLSSRSTLSTDLDRDLAHRESHHDSTYRSTRVGDSGIPHTSYAHTTSSFDSDRPYKNAVSNFSYNI